MARQFQPPQIRQGQTKEEAFAAPISQTLQSLPQLWRAYKLQNMQQEALLKEQEMKQRDIESRLGTGVNEAVQPGQLLSAPPPGAGAEEQMYDFEASMPTMGEETQEQNRRRIGLDAYAAETARIKAEQERPSRSQLKVTDRNVPVLFDPVGNTLVVQATGEEYDPASHGNIVVPGGPPVLAPNQNVEITDINAARKQLRDLVQGAKDSGFGTGNPLVEKARTSKANPLQYFDPKAQKFKQLTAATKQIIGKGLEGGVLRKEDEDKYEAIIPQPGDTTDILEAKANQLDSLLKQKQEERIKGFQSTFRGVPKGENMSPIGGQPKEATQDTIVDTQEEYDALPSGAVYIDSNGKRARKR